MCPNNFGYRPLPDGSIRLVQLSLQPSQHVFLDLCVHPLKTAPPFTALSYTWGGESRSQVIYVQDAPFRITPNLEAFLLEAKRRTAASLEMQNFNEGGWNGGWLWIDSICIDQENILEKNVQVAMMKDIYERAKTIISWLGELDDDAELGMEYILDLELPPIHPGHMPRARPSKFEFEDLPEEEWRHLRSKAIHAIHKLISRSYWKRVWIIQEATTPKEPYHSLVWCGYHTDDFEAFTTAAEWILRVGMVDDLPGKLHDASTDAVRGLITIRKMRQHFSDSDNMDLYFLLPFVHNFDATDPRDKIFGLSSLVPNEGIGSIVPDYSLNAREIYLDLASDLLERGSGLDILGFCATTGEFDLPSWVPDWTSTCMPKPFLRRTLDASLRLQSLYSAAGETRFTGTIDKDDGILFVSGYAFDGISWVATPRYINSGRERDIAMSWQIAALSPWSKYITGCTRQEALAHTVCADSACLNRDDQLFSVLGQRPAYVPLPDHDDDLGIFAWPDPLVRDSTVQRVMFFTDKGYMGLGPYTTLAGDQVCLLEGAQFPIILRPEVDDWTLVGESYVHGIMDGEGWNDMLNAGDIEGGMRTFAIR